MSNENGHANAQEKPCLVQAGQGFSVLYKGRYLYSRYNPSRAIVQTVEALPLIANTLILCASPCLCYGFAELAEKMPDGCFLLGLEADAMLYELAKTELPKLQSKHSRLLQSAALLHSDELLAIVSILTNSKAHDCTLPPIYSFRRAIIVEMSGGVAFNVELYRKLAFAAEDTIATFWKNRLTLTKFGRLYARNLFKNLARLPKSVPLAQLEKQVQQPILLFGAGESAETTLTALPRAVFKQLYVIAVDAALPILRAHGITPNCVVAVESQLAIEKAYIGNTSVTPLILADSLSRVQVTTHTRGKVSYFTSDYTTASFLRALDEQKLLPPTVPPLGSVGLTATYLALRLRASDNVPVFVTGLDFSFSLGKTHARAAPAHTLRLTQANRLLPTQNIDAAFKCGAHRKQGKSGEIFTDIALTSYASQFTSNFAAAKNLYDVGKTGLPLGIVRIGETELLAFITHLAQPTSVQALQETRDATTAATAYSSEHIIAFLSQEQTALERLKALLMYGEAASSSTLTAQEEIAMLLKPREYLYLHFPDGYECKATDISFLKRVRSEIDFFLKDITRSLLAITQN